MPLTPERWELAKGLFHQLLETDAESRPGLLDSSCGNDPQLRDEVQRLLAHHADASGFLEPLIPAAAAQLDALLSQAPTLLSPGMLVNGRFRILRFIGKGGMGEVYEAADELAGVQVALKTLRSGLEHDGFLNARFLREMQIARQVTHPNVCRIHDIFECRLEYPGHGGTRPIVFLTMELLAGENLADRLARTGPLPASDALPIVRDMVSALGAAHAQGVVHRDLKSSNVMLVRTGDRAPRAVLTDFGLAQASSGEADAGDEGLAGTPDYMAPEQFTGGEMGPQTDLFALGVVLYEMRTGTRPFGDSSTLTGAARRAGSPPDRPRLRVPGLENRWETAIVRCLEPDPSHRYAAAADVLAAIEGPPARHLASRRFALAAFGILGSGLWISKPWASRTSTPASAITVMPFQSLSPDPQAAELSRGLSEELIRVLSGMRGLKVVRNSNPGSQPWPLRQIGSLLGVGAVLTGSLRYDAGHVTVTAQLANVADGQWLWSGTFEESDQYLTRLRVNLSAAVAGAVAPRLSGARLAGFAAADVVNGEAYNYYVRAYYHTVFRLEAGLKTAVGYLSQSIAADPTFAPAHAMLSEVSNILAGHPGCPQEAFFLQSEREADRALELDSQLPEAHSAKGLIEQRYRWNWDSAEQHFRQALFLNSGVAAAHHRYAGFSSNLGRHDIALAEIRRAVDLDPYSPSIQTTYGALLYRARHFDEALAQFDKTRRMFESYGMARSETADCLGAKGHWDQAAAMYLSAAAAGSPEDAGFIHALGRSGRIEEARQKATALEAAFPDGYSSAVGIAVAYRGVGDFDKVFHWLNVAADRREPGLLTVKVDPANDPIRGDPRFSKLLERLRL